MFTDPIRACSRYKGGRSNTVGSIGVDKPFRHPHGGCEGRGCSPSRASPSKIALDRGKITAILGLGGGQNLLLDVRVHGQREHAAVEPGLGPAGEHAGRAH